MIYSQSTGAVSRVASGYPTELLADNQRTTVLDVYDGYSAYEAPTEPDGNIYFIDKDGFINDRYGNPDLDFVIAPQENSSSGKIPENFTANMSCYGNMLWADFYPSARHGATAEINSLPIELTFDFENRSVEGEFCDSADWTNPGWETSHADFCVTVKESDLYQNEFDGNWGFDGVWDVELDMSGSAKYFLEDEEWDVRSESIGFDAPFHGWIEPNDGSLYTDGTYPATFQFLCDFVPPEDMFEAGPPQIDQNQPSTQPGVEEVEDSSEQIPLAEMYDDLEEFLAGEGIEAPLPGRMVVNGLAVSTLLAAWLVLNQMAGIDTETSMEVIRSWNKGERPPIGAEAELPSGYGDVDGDVGAEGKVPKKKVEPVQEEGEDHLLRAIKDGQDFDDALKKTNKDIEAFEAKIPDQVKNLKFWKKYVEPKFNKIKNLAKKGELDKGRTWLDRCEQLLKLRNDVERDLDHLPADRREGVLVVERTLKVLGHFATDAYDTAFVVPAKLAGEKMLPAELAKKWNKSMDELSQGLSDVAQAVPEILHKGGRLVSDGKDQDQMQHIMENDPAPGNRKMAKYISDVRGFKDPKVPVKKFDFGRSFENVKNRWNETVRAFHDR